MRSWAMLVDNIYMTVKFANSGVESSKKETCLHASSERLVFLVFLNNRQASRMEYYADELGCMGSTEVTRQLSGGTLDTRPTKRALKDSVVVAATMWASSEAFWDFMCVKLLLPDEYIVNCDMWVQAWSECIAASHPEWQGCRGAMKHDEMSIKAGARWLTGVALLSVARSKTPCLRWSLPPKLLWLKHCSVLPEVAM